MAQTEVILCDKVEGLGAESDIVTVKAGFARNYLIPRGKAYEATKGNLRHMAALKKARAAREAEELDTARKLSKAISALRPRFTLETGAGGKAFGSVTSMDIHKRLENEGIEIDRHALQLKQPIKHSGATDIEVKLHPEVSTTLTVRVEAKEVKGAAAKPAKEEAKVPSGEE